MNFDPSTFMNQTVDTPLSTSFEICPEGQFVAVVGEVTEKSFRQIKWNDKESGEERTATIFSLPFLIQDEQVKAKLDRENVTASAEMWLDVDDAGQLDTRKGKNVMLGRIRDVVNQNNTPGWTFGMLSGQGPVRVTVNHEVNPKNPEQKFARVKSVVRL